MARIRTIKPEFFTSESVCSVSPMARLFFIGLWCESDREGLLKWKPKTLKFRYLPADDVDVNELSKELEDEGMIATYTVDGVDYCEIPSFKSHQVINNREKDSEIPSRVNHASTTRESGRKEGKERKEGKGTPRKVKTSLPNPFEVTSEMIAWFNEQRFAIELNQSTDRWKDAMSAGGYKYVDWIAAWRNGMKKANEWFVRDNPQKQTSGYQPAKGFGQ